MHALEPTAQPLFSGYIQDLTPAQARWVVSYALKIRRQMSRLLERCAIEIPAPSTSAMGRIRTSLTSLDVTLEDIHPEKLHGYGKMDSTAAQELSWTLQETRGLVGWLLSFLTGSAGTEMDDLGPAGVRPSLNSLCKRLVEIATQHGLVEFLPALQAIFRESQRHSCEVVVFGKEDAGKSSLINRLANRDLLPAGSKHLLGLPIRVTNGAEAELRVTFPDHVASNPLARLVDFAGEQENPGNLKRVVALDILAPCKRLLAGFTFVEHPGMAASAVGELKASGNFLPEADVALLLIDARTSICAEEMGLLHALAAAATPAFVLLSRCDLLADQEVERRQAEVIKAISAQGVSVTDVAPIGIGGGWAGVLDAWFEKAVAPFLRQSMEGMADSVEYKARSVGKSMLSILDWTRVKAAVRTGEENDIEPVLRRLDENLERFCSRWENNVDAISGWDKSTLDLAAMRLEGGSVNASQALTQAIVSQCFVLVREYQNLRSQINTGIGELKRLTDPDLVLSWELPQPGPIPLPLASVLRDVTISSPGTLARINQSASMRHFRKELAEKAGTTVRQALDELQPRFRHWFNTTMSAFRECFRMQTDPVRYREIAGACVERNEKLSADIAFLHSILDETDLGPRASRAQ